MNLPELRGKVRIAYGAARQILDHIDLVNEEAIISAVLSTPRAKRIYYTRNRFELKIKRRASSGGWKSVLIRVESETEKPADDLPNVSEEKYVVLLVHVESA